ncbi:hypothetical protein B1218_36000, partial [Pseudomonas ogarae]
PRHSLSIRLELDSTEALEQLAEWGRPPLPTSPASHHGDCLPLPLGKPTANTQVLALDSALRMVPTGLPPQFCIRGVGVARGYLRAPPPTRAALMPPPFHAGTRPSHPGGTRPSRVVSVLHHPGRLHPQLRVRVDLSARSHTAPRPP